MRSAQSFGGFVYLSRVTAIRQLSSDVINKIAAGEVVERPSSVVKELVENALDAGATRVDVEILGGGRDRILVSDDGKGMSREDAQLCIERHATSKLADAEGLFHIASYGFRGEAIPAIASVSRFTLTTREPDALEGTRIVIDGGRVLSVDSCGAPRGTSLEIRDLFHATPARRKFLKRAETEAGHIGETLVRLALARPDVSFSLRSGDRTSFRSPAGPDPRERIAAAIGKEIFEHLLPVEHVRGSVRVHGFAASPAFSLPTPRAIYLFVNGRFVRDRAVQHAMQRAYEGLLPSGRSPGIVLFVEVPPHEVDVNVHPQKLEVRFADPRGVYDAVSRALGDALGKGDWLKATVARPDAPARSYAVAPSSQPAFDWRNRESARSASEALWPREGDRAAAGGGEASRSRWSPAAGGAAPTSGAAPEGDLLGGAGGAAADAGENGAAAVTIESGGLRLVGVLGSSFLVCESAGGGVAIVDPRRLREGIARERLRAFADEGKKGQPFLFPVMVDPGMPAARLLLERIDGVRGLGFDLEPFGGTTFALHSVPSPLVGAAYDRLLVAVVEALGEGSEAALSRMAAFAAAAPQPALLPEEATRLLEEWREAGGREIPVVAELDVDELRRRAARS